MNLIETAFGFAPGVIASFLAWFFFVRFFMR